ncbi:hypothetical protein J2T13_002195 [Paenibacillus sp. DS2015]|uniref:hypothetical protein n=1 Tax=Paenibacillus sp. DS2015 TaxID=3373917 RepID=UPI003D19EF7C
MKKRLLLSVFVLLFILLYGCSNTSNTMSEPPEIRITAGDMEIASVVGLNQWNGSIYDREDTFHTSMKEKSVADVPYLQLNQEIQIEFKGTAPDQFELREYIVDASGSIKYTEKETKSIPFKYYNNTPSFILGPNPAAALSSDSADYEPGATIRGFRLNCIWGDNESEYAFIIRTDAI